MKVYIDAKQDPWVTWDKELWKASQNLKQKGFEITSIEHDADIIFLEWEVDMDWRPSSDQKYILFVGTVKEAENALACVAPFRQNVLILSDSVKVLDYLQGEDIASARWNIPSRVTGHFVYTDHLDTHNKTGGFVITCNGQRQEDNLTEILKTYFAICLQDDKQKEGELTLLHDVDIFSAQELTFETFNNVTFQGLQPNPKMFKMIKNAKLFISPYKGTGVPFNAIDAWMLGTPAIVRDTEVNRSIFNWTDKCFYKDEKELAKKIKFFSEIPVTDPDYIRMVDDGFNAIKGTHYVSNSLLDLIYLLKG